MKNERLENAVKNLVNLYTVVIGVALSLAVRSLFEGGSGLESVSVWSLMLFAAFLLTLVPFYHGALRHLDDAYLENDNRNIKRGALIVDFFLLFLHAIAFVVLSLLLKKPQQFVWLLVALLFIDVVWGVFAHFASSAPKTFSAEFKWTIINTIFVLISVCYLISQDIGITTTVDPVKLSTLVVSICLLRSLADYIWCSSFYFPEPQLATR